MPDDDTETDVETCSFFFIAGDFANVDDDINETLEADNYEDQLNPLDVRDKIC